MIKGINKQIIEIKCTDDECFDRVLLFVRADRSGLSKGVLDRNAEELCGRLLTGRKNTGKRLVSRLLIYALSLLAFIVGAAYVAVNLL